MAYPIPKRSLAAMQSLKSSQARNPGLIFERFAPDWGVAPDRANSKGEKAKADFKKEGLLAAANQPADEEVLQACSQRWDSVAAQIHAIPFSLKTDWRFIPGLGRKGPLEVGFNFHRYGFPILPSSSVKGLTRAWAFFQIVEMIQASDLKKLEEALLADGEKDEDRKVFNDWKKHQSESVQALAENFRAIFGTTAQAGGAIFLDALPTKSPKLELDIMNPHYPKYYSNNDFPTDNQNPIPVFFLTVKSNQEFRFAVGWRGVDNPALRQQAESWLKFGLKNLGAGAKTSAGYGYFG